MSATKDFKQRLTPAQARAEINRLRAIVQYQKGALRDARRTIDAALSRYAGLGLVRPCPAEERVRKALAPQDGVHHEMETIDLAAAVGLRVPSARMLFYRLRDKKVLKSRPFRAPGSKGRATLMWSLA